MEPPQTRRPGPRWLLVLPLVAALTLAAHVASGSRTAHAVAPPAGAGERPQRVLPAVRSADGGGYTLEDPTDRWDPCRVIHVVESGTPPPGDATVLTEALQQLSAASGLAFQLDGPTSEAAGWPRAAYQPGVYGRQWAPVLVAWTSPAQVPALAGSIIGLGGPVGVGGTYVSGEVSLDEPALERGYLDHDQVRAVLLHELGHVLGLGHTVDRREVMYPETDLTTTTLGPGDRDGLAVLGAGRCNARV